MSENGKGNTKDIIEFEELDAEEAPSSTKEEQLATFLKSKLSEEDFGSAAKILGVDTEDLSNAELLEKLTELLQGKKEEDPEEKPDEEKEMMDYKEYMKACMAEGKSMEECQAEFKKKYPDAKEEEAAAPEDLSKPKDENTELKALTARIAELEGKLELEVIENEVKGLVQEKHLSPRQVGPVTKLGAEMTPEMRTEFYNLFKSQKFTVGEDKGMSLNKRPGEEDGIDAVTRARILKEQGISDLISEKGVRRNN